MNGSRRTKVMFPASSLSSSATMINYSWGSDIGFPCERRRDCRPISPFSCARSTTFPQYIKVRQTALQMKCWCTCSLMLGSAKLAKSAMVATSQLETVSIIILSCRQIKTAAIPVKARGAFSVRLTVSSSWEAFGYHCCRRRILRFSFTI